MNKILVSLLVFGVLGILLSKTSLAANSEDLLAQIDKKVDSVLVTNFPSVFETKPSASKTILIGSLPVYVDAGDLQNISPLPNNTRLLGSYEGSGKLTYLVARGSNDGIGVRIVVDGEPVAESTLYSLDVLGDNSTGWKRLRPTDVIEINKEYPFKEKLEIYLFNHSFSPIKGGAHAEVEVY